MDPTNEKVEDVEMLKLNRIAWLRVCILALAALALIGCDDGDGSESEDTAGGDTSTNGDTTTGDTGGTPDGTTNDTSTTPDGTTQDTSTADMEPDTGPGEEIPITWPADPQAYVDSATTTSYLNTLIIPPLDENDLPTCCKDFGERSLDYLESEGATNEVDNALAKLADGLGGIAMIDVQATLDEQLQAGTFAILWDHREFNGEATGDFVLAGLLGAFDTGTTYTEANAGTGSFLVNPSSFTTGGTPIIAFNPASLNGGALTAGPSNFLLSLPLGVVNLEVSVSEAELTANATIGANGVTYADGTLSGYVLVEEIVRALNAFVRSDTCACLGLQGDIYAYDETTGAVTPSCMTPAQVEAACPNAEEEACRVIAGGEIEGIQACPILGSFLVSSADIDVNGDCAVDFDNCVFDALSLGLQWSAVPATLAGVAQ